MEKIRVFLGLFLLIFGNFFPGNLLKAQSVATLAQKAVSDTTVSQRLEAAERLANVLYDTLLQNPTSQWNRSNNFSVLEAEKPLVRVFTWCVPLEQGFYQYFGLIQTVTDTQRLFQLHDQFVYESGNANEKLTKERWHGALYSAMIVVPQQKNRIYTLLGWDGNDALSDIKLIDILTFDEQHEPQFGMGIFDEKGLTQRVLLQYRQNANCTLRYEGKTPSFSPKYRLIFSHLEAENPYFDGMKSMYVPTEIFDAYQWKNGRWNFLEDVDVRNQ